MIELLPASQSLLVLLFCGFVLYRAIVLIRQQIATLAPTAEVVPAQHPLLRAVDAAGAIGIGVIWTALLYAGPSLLQVWRGQGGVSHWTSVLLATGVWLSLRPPVATKTAAALWTTVAVRVVVYGLFFAVAIFSVNDW